jgi:hypothetical protein
MFYGKYFSKRKVLSLDLNVFNVSDFLISLGIEFHNLGAE